MTVPRHRVYKEFSGPVVYGTVAYNPIHVVGHWERAFYITSMVECNGLFGSVNLYDGTCVTAGLHQAILVYPKALATENFKAADDQGSLVALLSDISKIQHLTPMDHLQLEMVAHSWALRAGKLVYTKPKQIHIGSRIVHCKPGDLVYGADLRDTMCPPNGKVPKIGAQWAVSCKWAKLFAAVFSDPKTFDAQIKFGMDHNENVAKTRRVNNRTVADLMYAGNLTATKPFSSTALDIAMTMYFSHAVNAPAIANRCLTEAVTKTQFPGLAASTTAHQEATGRDLIKRMGTSSYGSWDDDLKNGRYQRTRTFMMKSAFWGADNFLPSGPMPANFPG